MHSPPVLAYGEFSRLTHLSVRTLRRYDDAGLLEPATVDPDSGYRHYTADPIATVQVIHRLRELDVEHDDVLDRYAGAMAELDAVELPVTTLVGKRECAAPGVARPIPPGSG
ncbi:MerR family transcriptional regulator [Blastococcus sp. SYSU DS0619]